MTRIVVLTSRENFAYYGTLEMLTSLEATWQNRADHHYEILIFNIDTMTLAELTPKLIGAEKLVVTCFNYRMCKVVQYIREILKLNLSFVIYVQNLATIAFWPYRYFASSELFFESDVFVASCKSDQLVLEAVFKNPIVHVLPFPGPALSQNKDKVLQKTQSILYIGRLTPQKNLHNLILAYSLLKKSSSEKIPPLIFFGKEDALGSPNMNLRFDFYLDFLKDLCAKLGIQDDVYFKGYIDDVLINDLLTRATSLFISPSLQSDENFSRTALRALVGHNQTILSGWGGYNDLENHFAEKIEFLPVTLAEYGPTISAGTIAQAITKCLDQNFNLPQFDLPTFYHESHYNKELENVLDHEFSAAPLRFTELADKIYEAKMDFSTSSTQIFSAFNDPLFLDMSRFYLRNQDSFTEVTEPEYLGVPWMAYENETFVIKDPHKGQIRIANQISSQAAHTIVLSDLSKVPTDKKICALLFRNGFIN